MSAIDLLISEHHHRAPRRFGWRQSHWQLRPGMKPSKEASQGAEVIYLDAETHTDIEEVGAANFFCIKDDVLYTPELTGTILPGITQRLHHSTGSTPWPRCRRREGRR